jgi:hypothetical protein
MSGYGRCQTPPSRGKRADGDLATVDWHSLESGEVLAFRGAVEPRGTPTGEKTGSGEWKQDTDRVKSQKADHRKTRTLADRAAKGLAWKPWVAARGGVELTRAVDSPIRFRGLRGSR